MSPWVQDLKFAQQATVAVEIRLYTGESLLTGVHSVDEDTDTFVVYAPQTMGDDTTRRRIGLNDIQSITVTDVDYPLARGRNVEGQ
jgi:hypothetical protein